MYINKSISNERPLSFWVKPSKWNPPGPPGIFDRWTRWSCLFLSKILACMLYSALYCFFTRKRVTCVVLADYEFIWKISYSWVWPYMAKACWVMDVKYVFGPMKLAEHDGIVYFYLKYLLVCFILLYTQEMCHLRGFGRLRIYL